MRCDWLKQVMTETVRSHYWLTQTVMVSDWLNNPKVELSSHPREVKQCQGAEIRENSTGSHNGAADADPHPPSGSFIFSSNLTFDAAAITQ